MSLEPKPRKRKKRKASLPENKDILHPKAKISSSVGRRAVAGIIIRGIPSKNKINDILTQIEGRQPSTVSELQHFIYEKTGTLPKLVRAFLGEVPEIVWIVLPKIFPGIEPIQRALDLYYSLKQVKLRELAKGMIEIFIDGIWQKAFSLFYEQIPA